MSKCKSCGGSLKSHGISPVDEKMCFVCYLAKMHNKHIDKIEDLEAKLAEKNKENAKLKEVVNCVDKLKQFNADMKDYALINKDVANEIYCEHQDKISFAVEQLEQLRPKYIKIINNKDIPFTIRDVLFFVVKDIDYQIKQLKEGK